MDKQAAAIDFLADAASHGLEDGAVERIDTHSAIVFLAGERVYKMKRAVDLGFLDFSRLADRRRFCHAEVTLNRRTAAELYLGVSTLTRDDAGHLAFDGEGETIEYVVVLQRFDQYFRFDRMAERGALTPALMRDLADRIADFHARADVVTDGTGAVAVRETVDGNRHSFEALAPGLLDARAAARLTERCRAAVDRVSERLDQRAGTGRVRACHGDLHLQNICLYEGAPTLFDCIEFNPALSEIDVLYDLAFLLMDLIHRGHAGLANTVFNRYLDRRDEADGVAALPLFMAMRAAIRAHVGAQAAVVQSTAQARAARESEARAYLVQALAFTADRAPQLVAVGGMSGTGKSSLAYTLAPQIGAPPGARVLRSDVWRKRRFGVAPEATLPPQAYQQEVSRAVYDALFARAGELLGEEHSVILDMVFERDADRAAAEAVAARRGVPFTGLWLTAPRAVLAERIRTRTNDASDATPAVLDHQLARETGRITWQHLDAGRPLATIAEAARRHLD